MFIFAESGVIMKMIFVLVTISLLFFTGCTKEKEESNIIDVSKNMDNYLDSYVEIFPEYQFKGEREATFGDRHFSLEVLPQNIPEALVTKDYYYDIAGEFEKLAGICGENDSLKISAINTKKQFYEGTYIKEYIIKELTVVKKNEIPSLPSLTFSLKEDVEKYGLAEFTVIKAKISMTHSEKSFNQGPQLGDGDYTRLFLCGQKKGIDAWKIYEVYWE